MTPPSKLGLVSLPLFAAESSFEGVGSSALGETLVIIAALAIIATALMGVVDRVRGGAVQKREVSISEDFATQKQHTELKEEVATIDNERRTSVANLHQRIEHLNETLNERIDAVPARTIALLNETKQLHTK